MQTIVSFMCVRWPTFWQNFQVFFQMNVHRLSPVLCMIWHTSLSTACQSGKELEILWCFSFSFCISHFQFVHCPSSQVLSNTSSKPMHCPKWERRKAEKFCIQTHASTRQYLYLYNNVFAYTPYSSSKLCFYLYSNVFAYTPYASTKLYLYFLLYFFCIYSLRKCLTGGKQFQFLFCVSVRV